MSVVYNTTISTNSGGSGAVSGTFSDVGNNDLLINSAIPAGSTNFALGIVFNGANLQNLVLVANQNVTLYVNAPSTGSPFATINLKAGIPYPWSNSASYFSNPLNVNVTNIYATCTSACILRGRVLTT